METEPENVGQEAQEQQTDAAPVEATTPEDTTPAPSEGGSADDVNEDQDKQSEVD